MIWIMRVVMVPTIISFFGCVYWADPTIATSKDENATLDEMKVAIILEIHQGSVHIKKPYMAQYTHLKKSITGGII